MSNMRRRNAPDVGGCFAYGAVSWVDSWGGVLTRQQPVRDRKRQQGSNKSRVSQRTPSLILCFGANSFPPHTHTHALIEMHTDSNAARRTAT